MVIPIVIVPSVWWVSMIVIGITAVIVITTLLILERFAFYSPFFVQKKPHEVVISFIIFFIVMAGLTGFFYGYRGGDNKYYVIISILAWSLGDAAASIFGHIWGKHKVKGKLIEGSKSVEGSVACLAIVFTFSFMMLLFLMQYVWWIALLASISLGIGVSLTELFTKKGLDNFTCPLIAGIILFLFSLI